MARSRPHPSAGSTALPWILLLASVALVGWLLLDRESPVATADLDAPGTPATPFEIERTIRSAPAVEIPSPAPAPERAEAFEAFDLRAKPSALLARARAEPRVFRRLIAAGRAYFAADGPTRYVATGDFARELLRAEKRLDASFLATPDARAWLVEQCRGFDPPLWERTWHRTDRVTTLDRKRVQYVDLAGLRFSARTPEESKDTRSEIKRRTKDIPRKPPLPVLVTLHADGAIALDGGGSVPPGVQHAVTALARAHDEPSLKALRDGWYVLEPILPKGGYHNADGRPDDGQILGALEQLWRRAHVDFDRFILEGGREAFDVLTHSPFLYAGAVLRGGWRLGERDDDNVLNFANVPLYVLEDEDLARRLRDAGHCHVTVGTRAGQVAWMSKQRRQLPLRFRWNADDPGQAFAWWVQLEGLDWHAPMRCIDVEALDTEADPNTIRIRATGMEDLTLLLDPTLVDLDHPVRVVLNGRVAAVTKHDWPTRGRRGREVATFERGQDLDALFDAPPVRVRASRYYAWSFPARMRIRVEPDDAPSTCAPPVEVPTPEPVRAPPPAADFIEAPPPPAPYDPGDVELESTPTPRTSDVDWRWLIAAVLAVGAVLIVLRRR